MHTLIDTRTLIKESGIGDFFTAEAVLSGYLPPPLLADELGIRFLEEAEVRLTDYLLPETTKEADEYLSHLNSIFRLLDLYQHYFPEKFAASTKKILPAKDAAYSEREYEFFELISNNLFPLPLYMVDDFLERENREYGFPLTSMGREWWNDDISYWELGWLLLLWLTEEQSPQEVMRAAKGKNLDPRIFEISVKQGKRFAIEALSLHCRKLPGPLAHLPIALKILWHDTGCWFLDISSEHMEFLAWSRREMNRLIKHGRLFDKFTDQADQLMTWIEKDPFNNFKEVIQLWNLYVLEEQDSPVMLVNRPPQP
jgi:hypothetical protein